MKKAIFTVNLYEYDFDPSPALGNSGWDRILFTDSGKIESYGWNKRFKVKPMVSIQGYTYCTCTGGVRTKETKNT